MSYYQPIITYPNNGISIDSSQDIDFTVRVEGEYHIYKITIYKISDNTVLHNTGNITLNPTLKNHQTLTRKVTGGTIPNGIECYWTFTVSKTGDKTIVSRPFAFRTEDKPTLTFNTPEIINSHEYEFSATYSQTQGVSANKFKFTLYDKDKNEIENSDWISSSDVKYKFSGFFRNSKYFVKCVVVNNANITTESNLKEFDVTYDPISIDSYPSLEIDKNTSIAKIEWSQVAQIDGVTTGTYEYIQNFLKEGDVALRLQGESTLQYNREIPANSTTKFVIQINSNFNGIVCELLNGTELHYNNTSKKFELKHGNIIVESQVVDVDSNKQLIIIRQSIDTELSLKVIEFGNKTTFTTWEYVRDNYNTWQDILDNFDTWSDVLNFKP